MIWLNGAMRQATEARIDPADRGFTLGDGVFETIRARAGSPCHTERHLARLRRGAALLGIPVGYDDRTLVEAMRAVLAASNPTEAAIRLTLTRGPAERGLAPPENPSPTVLIAAGPLPPPAPPAQIIIASGTCRNERSPLCGIKSLNYLDSILARQEAQAQGADDALLLNTRGVLACATAATLLLRINGSWLTPRQEDGALPGIARALHLEQGTLTEARLTPQDALDAQAACLLNTLSLRQVATIRSSRGSRGGGLAPLGLASPSPPNPQRV